MNNIQSLLHNPVNLSMFTTLAIIFIGCMRAITDFMLITMDFK
jgi:hypothetical protein